MSIPGLQSAIIGARALPFSITYLGNIEYASGSEINGAIDIGAADAGKEIFVVVSVTYNGVKTLDASTVAGVTVTRFTTEFTSTDAKQTGCFVSLPTQAGSQTVDLNFSNVLGSGVAFVFKVLNRPGIGTQHTDTDGDSGDAYGGGTNTSITIQDTTIASNGIWLMTGMKNVQQTISWNNGTVTDQVDNLLSNRAWCAYRDPQASGSTPSDVFSWVSDTLCSGASWAFS